MKHLIKFNEEWKDQQLNIPQTQDDYYGKINHVYNDTFGDNKPSKEEFDDFYNKLKKDGISGIDILEVLGKDRLPD